MLKRIHHLPVIVVTLVAFSACQPYRATYIEGPYKTLIRSYKYPGLLFPMKITGKRVTTDTVTDRVVEQNYYKTSVGVFRHRNIMRTVTYDPNNKKRREVIVENGRRTTIEYVRN